MVNNLIVVYLRYKKNKIGLRKMGMLSKPSHRIYLNKKQLMGRRLIGFSKNTGPMILRTNLFNGWLTDGECMLLGLGGEPSVLIG
jgi:ribosomal protein S8